MNWGFKFFFFIYILFCSLGCDQNVKFECPYEKIYRSKTEYLTSNKGLSINSILSVTKTLSSEYGFEGRINTGLDGGYYIESNTSIEDVNDSIFVTNFNTLVQTTGHEIWSERILKA